MTAPGRSRRLYVFADESGDLVFSRNGQASRYFILVTMGALDCAVGDTLQALRRELAWQGIGLDREFHATEDLQAVRDKVFPLIADHRLRIDATILEKSKAHPHLRSTSERFYQYAWHFHFKRLAERFERKFDEVLVVSATIGTKRERKVFRAAVVDVAAQALPRVTHQVAAWQAGSDPCLQAVDYCSWAIGRKWERGDDRSHQLIATKIQSEFDLFSRGNVHHY